MCGHTLKRVQAVQWTDGMKYVQMSQQTNSGKPRVARRLCHPSHLQRLNSFFLHFLTLPSCADQPVRVTIPSQKAHPASDKVALSFTSTDLLLLCSGWHLGVAVRYFKFSSSKYFSQQFLHRWRAVHSIIQVFILESQCQKQMNPSAHSSHHNKPVVTVLSVHIHSVQLGLLWIILFCSVW
jgi:hypothetical protein